MIAKKSKPVATTNIAPSRTDKQPIRAKLEVMEFIAGHGEDTEIYNVEGCSLAIESVLARLYPTDPFHLYVKLGTDWFDVLTIQPDDPSIQGLRDAGVMVKRGPSPSQLANQSRKEVEEREKQELEELRKQRRAEHARMLREQEEERKRKAIEGRNASVGP